jgi:ubiquinone/menaquinone biosynthesis C-methylase UbiE
MDPTERFSTRVEHYVRSRPRYPAALSTILGEACGLTSGSVVADIGSGTGILTELFLQNGNQVFAVEPNARMRHAGERLLNGDARFHSVPGRAEATTLPDRSVDIVAAGQAFHWFDRGLARAEFVRILKPGGWVVLIWNERLTHTTPFLEAYEQLLERYATEYAQVDHRHIDEGALAAFFAPDGCTSKTLANRQEFDYAHLEGRLLSSSYAPEPDHLNHAPMLAALAAIFEAHQHEGRVAFEYATRLYYGRLS